MIGRRVRRRYAGPGSSPRMLRAGHPAGRPLPPARHLAGDSTGVRHPARQPGPARSTARRTATWSIPMVSAPSPMRRRPTREWPPRHRTAACRPSQIHRRGVSLAQSELEPPKYQTGYNTRCRTNPGISSIRPPMAPSTKTLRPPHRPDGSEHYSKQKDYRADAIGFMVQFVRGRLTVRHDRPPRLRQPTGDRQVLRLHPQWPERALTRLPRARCDGAIIGCQKP